MAVKASSHTGRGYQVNFVEQPSEGIQVECPICLSVLFEPKLAACCGHSFCAACIDPIERDRKPCPMCIKKIKLVDDKRLERTLNGLTVFCPHKEKGCQWTGELREVNNHLNKQPATDNLKGCQFQEICCEVCRSHWCERRLMENHVANECPEREIECEYHYVGCNFKGLQVELDGHMSEAMNIHLSLLTKFVQSSLSQKDNEIEKLRELSQHGEVKIQQLTEKSRQVQQQCTKQSQKYRQLKKRMNLHWLLILLLFIIAGVMDGFLYLALNSEPALHNCSQSLQVEHISSLYVKKIDLVGLVDEQILQLSREAATDIKRLGGQVQEVKDGAAQKRTKLKAEVDELTLAVNKVRQDVKEITNDMNKVNQSLVNIKKELSQKKSQESCACGIQSSIINEEIQQIRSEAQYLGEQVDFPTLPYHFNLTHVRERKHSKSRWLSMPFYTHEGGYRMRLVVHPNGIKTGAGTHVSVALHLMNGKHDHLLDWPPNITLKVTLYNQLHKNDHHIDKSFTFSPDYHDATVISRVWKDTMAENGIQIMQFAAHHIALVPTNSHSYLEHDSLYFGVELEKVDNKRWYNFWS